jgi:hypothetical protein
MFPFWTLTASYQRVCVARRSRFEGNRSVTRISDKRMRDYNHACVFSTNHNSAVPISHLYRAHGVVPHPSRIRECVALEDEGFSREHAVTWLAYFRVLIVRRCI